LTLWTYTDLGANSGDNQKNVLIICALAPTTPAYKPILDGIRQELYGSFRDSCNLHVEYLETERYPADKYPPDKLRLIVEKYNNVNLDLLVGIGINVVSTIKKFQDTELLSLPALIIDFDLSGYQMPFDMRLNPRTAVLGIKLDIRRTLLRATELFPKTSGLYVISGKSENDKLLERLAHADIQYINEDVNVTFVSGKTMDENLRIVRHLPDNCLVLIPAINTDGNNVPYFNTEAIRLISSSARAPVFTYSDTGFGDGSFGGEILSFNKVGETAGKTSVKILNGTDPATIDLSGIDYYDHLLDWRLLEKWDQTALAGKGKGYKTMYREYTFLGKYKWLLISGIVFILMQSFLITSLVRLNRKQRRLTRQIVDSDKRYIDIVQQDRIQRMGMLTASISHELNQPLTAILSTAQAGKRFVEAKNTDPALLKEIFENIVEDNNRAASVLKSIRGMMKLEKREKERIDINILITQIAELYRSKAIELNSRVNVFLPDGPVYVMADAIQIQQVLLNFITNASSAMKDITGIEKTIDIKEYINNEFVSVSVRDYGAGFDESIKSSMFKPFVTSKKEGIGIGLSISKLIIEEHDGTIEARNLPEGGAEFSFSLKIADEPES
jgi:signal transduction histidine kinase